MPADQRDADLTPAPGTTPTPAVSNTPDPNASPTPTPGPTPTPDPNATPTPAPTDVNGDGKIDADDEVETTITKVEFIDRYQSIFDELELTGIDYKATDVVDGEIIARCELLAHLSQRACGRRPDLQLLH